MTSRLAADINQSKADDSPWLPPGFRFHPTDEELVVFYLTGKVVNGNFPVQAIAEVDLNKCEPWDLPAKAKMGEKEWYFFSLRDRKYPTGMRTNRATEAGYWKATGKDREVMSSRTGGLVGMKKTLVFYRGRAPKGEKTNWIMHEYRIEGPDPTPLFHSKVSKDEWVVCRIFQKSAGGKKIPMECNTSNRSSSYDTDPQARSSLPALLESPNPNSMEESDCNILDGPRGNNSFHSFVQDALRSSEHSWGAGLKTEVCGSSGLVRCPSYLSDLYATDLGNNSGLKGDILNEGYPKLLRQNSSFNLQQVHELMSLKYLDHQSSPRGLNTSLRPCKAEPYAGGEEDEAQGRSMESWVADHTSGSCSSFSNGGGSNESGTTDLDNSTSGFLRSAFHHRVMGAGAGAGGSAFISDPTTNSATMDMADCLWAY